MYEQRNAADRQNALNNAFVSTTSHAGTISELLTVFNHRPFAISTGGMISLVVKATRRVDYKAIPNISSKPGKNMLLKKITNQSDLQTVMLLAFTHSRANQPFHLATPDKRRLQKRPLLQN